MAITGPLQQPQSSLARLPRDLIASRELLLDLVRKDLRVRYRYAALGFLWAVLEPLAYMVVLTVLFERVLAPKADLSLFGPEIPFASGLLCGLVFWQFTTQALSAATGSLIENQNLVKKVCFTREVVPLAACGYPALALAIGFCVLLVVHLALGGTVGPNALWLVPFFALQAAITLGAGLFAAALNVRFRDVGYMVNVALLLGFYASPVFYDLDGVLTAAQSGHLPDAVLYVYLANPMAELLEAYRQALLEGHRPDGWLFIWPACCAALALVGGSVVFRRNAPTLSDYL